MSDKELAKRITRLREAIDEEGVRIRRYTMDPRLKKPADATKDPNRELREQLEADWKTWFALKGKSRTLPPAATEAELVALETECDEIERATDLVQRDLISESSFTAGVL